MFKDVGIALKMEGLRIEGDEDSLATAMQKLWLEQKPASKSGVIEVKLERFKPDESAAHVREDKREDFGKANTDVSVPLTECVFRMLTRDSQMLDRDAEVVAGHSEKGEEVSNFALRLPGKSLGHYATFRFHYSISGTAT